MAHTYKSDFFTEISRYSLRSAQEIVPLIIEMAEPRSVVDVGCGTGTWLAVFRELGVDDVCGVDGDYVDRGLLQIPHEKFVVRDLAKPFTLNRVFDLVVSLEVAEHLPLESAETFVSSLVELGPVILFSAAVPRQGGDHHVNEQWPEYWARQFRSKGYQGIDCVREKVWNNEHVAWWYAQNSVIYVRRESLERLPHLKEEQRHVSAEILPLVHPRLYLMARDFSDVPLRRVLSALPRLFKRALRRRVSHLPSNAPCQIED
jgi:SAM-dependent methyltransferase